VEYFKLSFTGEKFFKIARISWSSSRQPVGSWGGGGAWIRLSTSERGPLGMTLTAFWERNGRWRSTSTYWCIYSQM
jgi:hypothetical protein